MKTLISIIRDRFLHERLDFRVRLFNVLAMAGILISLLSTVSSVLNGEGVWSLITNLATAPIAYCLMSYASRSGRYQLCYIITIVVIFFLFFPAIFFVGGGYYGAMPSFFIFAVLFTVFMLDGHKALILASAEILLYAGICVFGYLRPGSIVFLDTEAARVRDIIIGFAASSVSLGVTMFLHFRMYNQQQLLLEKAREEAVRASETKTTFLANMSHEIRTPINVILGMNEMILRECESERIADYGRNIQTAGKTLLTLINNILDVSKIESGKMEVVKERYYTAELIAELSMVGSERSDKGNIAFVVKADESLPRELVGDYVHIKQVVANFLSNAMKYTRQGSVTLRVGCGPASGKDVLSLRVAVEDTGIGIRDEHLSLLFDAFTRVDLPAHRNIEGTGLGLAIAKELTERMGGQISVESRWGRGSVFSVEIPQAIGDAAPMGPLSVHPATAATSSGDNFIAPEGRVLVVDDNAENLEVVKALLGRTMMRVDAVCCGEECLAAAGKTRYHLLLVDYMMPGMDGAETLRRLRELPGFDAPVIALTANAIAGTREMLLREGFAAYLSKPVMWRELEETLLRCLPEELVSRGNACPAPPVSEAIREALARELAAYDLVLDEGLRYLGGDLFQFRNIAEFFVEHCDQNRLEFQRGYDERDWCTLTHCVHSLKSRARGVGALDLHYAAARLETRCAASDSAYIESAVPLLLLEWERARDGLAVLIRRMETVAPGQESAPRGGGSEDDLRNAIRANRHWDAEQELMRLLADVRPEDRSVLEPVLEAVRMLEFESAEELFSAYLEERRESELAIG